MSGHCPTGTCEPFTGGGEHPNQRAYRKSIGKSMELTSDDATLVRLGRSPSTEGVLPSAEMVHIQTAGSQGAGIMMVRGLAPPALPEQIVLATDDCITLGNWGQVKLDGSDWDSVVALRSGLHAITGS
jgi:hypothetical protein